MSLPSASGDERYGDSKPQSLHNVSRPSTFQFLGGLPHPRSHSELLQDSTPGDTPSSLSLPNLDAKQDAKSAPDAKEAPHRTLKIDHPAKSRNTPAQKLEHDAKPHAVKSETEDEKLSISDYSAEASSPASSEEFTIYDAVAGRLGYDGLVKPNQQPVAASDYLFRHQHGPEHDASYEQWSAHRHLEHRLPDSDLLKAIHAHASDFYGAMLDGKGSFESMDETALIALGILLEEATAEGLGETGDLAFVEAASPDEVDRSRPVERRIKRQKIKHEGGIKVERGTKAESGSSDDLEDRGRKRRREAETSISEESTGDEDDPTPVEEGPSHNSDVESWISQTLLEGEPSSQFGTQSDLPYR